MSQILNAFKERVAKCRTMPGVKRFLRLRPLAISARSLNRTMPVTLENLVAQFEQQQVRAIAEGTDVQVYRPQLVMYATDCLASYTQALAACEVEGDPAATETAHRDLWLACHDRTRRTADDWLNAANYTYVPPTPEQVAKAERDALAARFATKFTVKS